MSETNITFEVLKKKWEQIISKIENEAIDDNGVEIIRLRFHIDKNLFEMGLKSGELTHKTLVELHLLESQVEVALQIAQSRFKLKNRGILAQIFGRMFGRIFEK
jgi:hypothetical protein